MPLATPVISTQLPTCASAFEDMKCHVSGARYIPDVTLSDPLFVINSQSHDPPRTLEVTVPILFVVLSVVLTCHGWNMPELLAKQCPAVKNP
jgi:hypothetical protein